MKIYIVLISIISSLSLSAQFKTRIYNIHSDIPLNQTIKYNGVKYSTSEMVFGGNVCVGNKYINTMLEYDYHKVNLSQISGSPVNKINIHEFLFGLRYYPSRPTFMLGKVAFRLTAGWSGGFDLDIQTHSIYFVGFGITGIRNPSGILVQFNYRRAAKPIQGYLFQPYWGIRLGFVIGPTNE